MLRGPGGLRCRAVDRGCTPVVWHEWFQLPSGAVGLTQAVMKVARLAEADALP